MVDTAVKKVAPRDYVRTTLKTQAGEGIAAGQTATFRMPIGKRFHNLMLTYSGATLAQLTEIRVIANSKVIHRYSATVRDDMNQFDGLAAASGVLVIPFDRQGLKSRAGEEETAMNTGVADKNGYKITSLYVEIDIDAAAVGTALSFQAEQSEALDNGPGTVLHILKYTRDPAGAGDFEISDLTVGKQTSMALNRIWFAPSANDISRLVIERNGYTLFDRTKAMNEVMQTNGVRTPQAGYHCIDTTEHGYGGSPISLLGMSDYRYRLTMTGACALSIWHETLGLLGD